MLVNAENEAVKSLRFHIQSFVTGNSLLPDILSLVPKINPITVTSIAIEARQLGLRQIPFRMAIEMTRLSAHKYMVPELLETIIEGPGDLVWYYVNYAACNQAGVLSAQTKKGLARAFEKFGNEDYEELAMCPDLMAPLRKIIRLVHPKPQDDNQAEIFRDIAKGVYQAGKEVLCRAGEG